MLSLSIPLSGWLQNSYVNYAMTQNNMAQASHQVGLSGNAAGAHNLSWNVQQSWTCDNEADASNLAMGYDGTYGSLNGSYAYRTNASASTSARAGVLLCTAKASLSRRSWEKRSR
jgi:outer membrane usher protein